uniref:Uncharacterized protein n=1 Tax=Schistosoma haematobium TaxID=6185 RepID=A0A095C8B3_SCHHA
MKYTNPYAQLLLFLEKVDLIFSERSSVKLYPEIKPFLDCKLSTTNVTQSEAFTSCQPDETTELTSTTADYSYGKNSPNQSVDDNQSVGASFVIEALLTTQYPESVVNETEYWKSPVLRMQDLLSLQQNPLFEEDILTSLEIFEKLSMSNRI